MNVDIIVASDDFIPTATIIADSVSPAGARLTTVEVRIHRFILAELNAHRSLSRSSASSRAVPVAKTLARMAAEPVFPLSWPTERPGMSGGGELTDFKIAQARRSWRTACEHAVWHANFLSQFGVHKSVVNRLLEPFTSHTVILSATDWDNFFTQRCSPLAQPEMRVAAEAIKDAYDASEPVPVANGRWHLPYIQTDEREQYSLYLLRRVSAARCARVSYLTHDGVRDITADLALYDKLVAADPPHASPLEHVATPVLQAGTDQPGNFTGWLQLRHIELDTR